MGSTGSSFEVVKEKLVSLPANDCVNQTIFLEERGSSGDDRQEEDVLILYYLLGLEEGESDRDQHHKCIYIFGM